MMHKMLCAIALGLVAGACALPGAQATPPPDDLATRVSGTLTALPAPMTLPPEQPPQATEPPSPEPSPTATAEPTESPPTETFTPEPSDTPTASFTPLATPTPLSGDIRAQLGSPTWRDPLDAGGNWPLGEDDFTRAEVEGGEMALTGLSTTDGWRLTWPEIEDFYLEMSVTTGTCAGADHYGLMLRVPDRHAADRGYLFGFTCDGRYSLRAWDGETMTSLIRATASSSIVAGSDRANRMGVLADGHRLVLYANGTQIDEIDDDTFTDAGVFGVFIGARQTEQFTVRISEIAYWDNP